MESNFKHRIRNMNLKKILILMLMFPLIGFSADPPELPEDWSSNYAYVNGIRIHYYQAKPSPNKPVIVMVHGITDNGLCWATLAQELEDDYNIFMLDARGHGLSDPFTSTDDEKTLMEDVVDFVEVMEFENPILMGHSMGAATVMRLGAEYPDLAKAIIMLDPFIARAPQTRDRAEKNRSEETSEAEKPEEKEEEKISVSMHADPQTLVKQNNYNYEELVELGTKQFPMWHKKDVQYWALSKKQYHGAYTDNAWQIMSGNMRTGDALENIEVPGLILKADAPENQREANLKAVEGLKNIKLMHLKDTGHNLHHDDLKLTVKNLNDFLSKL